MVYISNNFATDHFFFNTDLYIRIFVFSVKVYPLGRFWYYEYNIQNKKSYCLHLRLFFNFSFKYDYRQNESLSLELLCFQIQFRQKKGQVVVGARVISGILVFKLSLKYKQQEIILTRKNKF